MRQASGAFKAGLAAILLAAPGCATFGGKSASAEETDNADRLQLARAEAADLEREVAQLKAPTPSSSGNVQLELSRSTCSPSAAGAASAAAAIAAAFVAGAARVAGAAAALLVGFLCYYRRRRRRRRGGDLHLSSSAELLVDLEEAVVEVVGASAPKND